MTDRRTWEYGSIVAVQTGRQPRPIRVLQINGRIWNEGRIWDESNPPLPPDEALNLMGEEGWELVGVVTAQDGWADGTDAEPPVHRGRTFIFYLKRERH